MTRSRKDRGSAQEPQMFSQPQLQPQPRPQPQTRPNPRPNPQPQPPTPSLLPFSPSPIQRTCPSGHPTTSPTAPCQTCALATVHQAITRTQAFLARATHQLHLQNTLRQIQDIIREEQIALRGVTDRRERNRLVIHFLDERLRVIGGFYDVGGEWDGDDEPLPVYKEVASRPPSYRSLSPEGSVGGDGEGGSAD